MVSRVLTKPNRLLAVLLLAAVPVITLSCTSPPEIEPYNYFKASSNYAEISGYSAGFMPGDSATFTIGLKNPAGQTIQGEFCLLLLNEEGVAAILIGKRPYTVDPESSFSSPEKVTFPGTLPEGPYGLAFVLPDNFRSVTNIWIGRGEPQTGGPWPEISSCPD